MLEAKCKVLIREPNAQAVDEITVCGKQYKTTDPLRYLGLYITARLERPKTIRTRCRNTVRLSRTIMDLLKKYKPSWQVGRVTCETVIAPAMLYGTQISVLTKYSRRSLRGYEKQIVQGMASLCSVEDGANGPNTTSRLLQKRRITKKVRVHQLRWWGHVRRQPSSHPTRVAGRMRATHLRSCRPSFTWWDMIKQNMARYGDLSYDSWKQLAMDRDKFHKKLLDIYDEQESDDSDSGNEYFYFIYHSYLVSSCLFRTHT